MKEISEYILMSNIEVLMSTALITKDEFKSCFAILNKYGEIYPEWPRRTILLYKLTLKNDGIPIRNVLWERLDNIPYVTFPFLQYAKHSELVMLENIYQQITVDGHAKPITTFELEVYSSYSPCQPCADKLIRFQAELKEKRVNVHMAFQFANFYNDYPGCQFRDINIKGLKDMIHNDIQLSIFQGENDWKRFLMAACVNDETKRECLKVATEKGRTKREADDAEKIKKYKEDKHDRGV